MPVDHLPNQFHDLDPLWEVIIGATTPEQLAQNFGGHLQQITQSKQVVIYRFDWQALRGVAVAHTGEGNLNLGESFDTSSSSVTDIIERLKTSQPVVINQPPTQRVYWPIPINRALAGFVALEMVESSLSDDFIGRLYRTMKFFGQAYERLTSLKQHQSDSVDTHLLQLTFTSANEGMLLLSQSGQVVDVNQRMLTLFGKDHGYFLGKKLSELTEIFPPDCLQLLLRNFGFIKMGMAITPQEVSLIDSAGVKRILEITSTSLTENQIHQGELISIRDITYRKTAESQAQESESKLRQVLDSVKEGITLSDSSGKFEIFNQEMQVLTGFDRDQANEATSFLEMIHPGPYTKPAYEALNQVKPGEKYTSENVILDREGKKKYVSVSTTMLQSEGKTYYLSAYHDQTAVRLAEEELKARNQQLEETSAQLKQTAAQLLEARDHLEDKVAQKTKELQDKVIEIENLAKFPSEDPFPVMRVSSEGTLLYANSASKALLDTWGCEVGKSVPAGWANLVQEVFESNNRKIFESELLQQIISFVLVPVKSRKYVNLYGRDVSREKQVEEMKNQFISMVSHQIRTPLTSIRWYSEMLLKGVAGVKLNQQQTKVTETIHQTATNMSGLVNDLLSISRMESGVLDYQSQQANLKTMIDEIVTELTPLAQKGGVTLTVEVDPAIPDFKFDPKLIREVYTNLISNAIKYTKKSGQVEVLVKLTENQVISQVKDTGIGIPLKAQKDIFTRFYRAQNAVDMQYEGTGLGLSVAKLIVEKAGGSISFESTENIGTTFTFSIPLTNML